MTSTRLGYVLPALGLLVGCDVLSPRTCTTDVQPAVTIAVQDSATGVPIAGGATGRLLDGEYVAPLMQGFTTDVVIELEGGYERPGVYDVELAHPGYLDWRIVGVRVADGECHVQTVRLTARMQSLP